MAVYTTVSFDAVADYLAAYDIGALSGLDAIAEGVENTNYRITTTTGRYILTLFERRVREADLPFFMDAMAHVAAHGVNAPRPVAARDGAVIRRLADRPAAITTFLDGAPDFHPEAERLRSFGETVAALHRAAAGFSSRRANALSLDGWRDLADKTRADAGLVRDGLAAFIDEELGWISERWPSGRPAPSVAGLVHADLFPDNVFFSGDRVSGVIDFYFSCTDYFAYDLAIVLNAWCSTPAGSAAFNEDTASAIIDGYRASRPLAVEEKALMPAFLRGSALRFLLTRLYDWQHQVDGAVVNVKDPLEYAALIEWHRAHPDATQKWLVE